jgi:flagellar biosynthetic protein FlhB
MAEGDEDLEKTEEPTSRRIEEAVKKGQVAFSREVTSFLLFVSMAIIVIWVVPAFGKNAISFLGTFIISAGEIPINYENFDEFMADVFKRSLFTFITPVLVCIFAVLVASFMQNGFIYSIEPLVPKLEKISIFKGFKRIFSWRSVMEFFKGLIKIIIISYITYLVFLSYENEILATVEVGINGIMDIFSHLAFLIILGACVLMMIVAVTDFLYQRFEYMKSLKMTKQEIKEEYKQTEGNPEIKAKLKQIRQERARRRMMAAVPKADVVIRNPTHYAVALKYEQVAMSAPRVLALGQDLVALNIIRVAEENDVAIVTDRNLAKALYESAELDQEIPLEHYKAVAEVIAYVYKLKNIKL